MKWFKNNSLSIVFLLLFFFAMIGQTVTGLKQYNEEVKEHGGQEISIGQNFSSGDFIEATFEKRIPANGIVYRTQRIPLPERIFGIERPRWR